VRYSRLHEDRARRIAELYEKFVKVSLECQECTLVRIRQSINRNDAFNNLQERFFQLSIRGNEQNLPSGENMRFADEFS